MDEQKRFYCGPCADACNTQEFYLSLNELIGHMQICENAIRRGKELGLLAADATRTFTFGKEVD